MIFLSCKNCPFFLIIVLTSKVLNLQKTFKYTVCLMINFTSDSNLDHSESLFFFKKDFFIIISIMYYDSHEIIFHLISTEPKPNKFQKFQRFFFTCPRPNADPPLLRLGLQSIYFKYKFFNGFCHLPPFPIIRVDYFFFLISIRY